MFNETIFRKYDIRGVFGRDFDLGFTYNLAKAYCTYLINNTELCDNPEITIGYDARLTSAEIADAFTKGAVSSGFSVVNIGMCPTPLIYYSLQNGDYAGGVMITGSHNPPNYNGFKMCAGDSSIFGSSLADLKNIIKKGYYKSVKGAKPIVQKKDFAKSYLDYFKKYFKKGKRKIRAAVDAGNGTGGRLLVKALRDYDCEVFELFTKPDGRFPNHHPDPAKKENMADLIKCVKENSLDIGIALDGDGDRLGIVDDKGSIVDPDIYMILFAKEILARVPDAVFIAEVKCSQALFDEVKKAGGGIIMYKTGHSLIKSKMKKVNALLAGEMSGHIFFADGYFGYDDAIYSAMRLVKILSDSEASLSALVKPYRIYQSTPEIRIDVDDDVKFAKMDDLTRRFFELKESGDTIEDIITIDGIRIVFEDGWGLVRPSNTEPHLVLRFEAKDKRSLANIKDFVLKEVKK